jgi:hypothetical protein
MVTHTGLVKRPDVADEHVLELAQRWHEDPWVQPGVIAALVAEGVPEKVALAKVLHMVKRDLLGYGVSPYYAWPA